MDSPTQPDALEVVRGKATISVPAAAKVLGIGRNAAYEAAANGTLPTLRFGKSIRVPVAKLSALLGLAEPDPVGRAS